MNELLLQIGDPTDVVPFFSPASFLVFLDDAAIEQLDVPEVRAAVHNGDTKRAAEKLRSHANSLSPIAESSFLRAFTAPFHECKHFWDFIGTTYGLARLGLELRKQIDTESLLRRLSVEIPLELPLLANLRSKPSNIRGVAELISEIVETRFREQILDDVGVRVFPADRPLEECPFEARLIVKGPNDTHCVPAYAARGMDPHTKQGWIVAVPFGGRAVCEGAAMALELDILSGVFGPQIAEERKRDFMGFSPARPARSYYGACDLYLSRHVSKFPFDLIMALCDLALLGEADGKDRDSFHPGWRFCKAVKLVAEEGWPERPADWEGWYVRLFHKLNGRPLESFLASTRSWLAEQIVATKSLDSGFAPFIATLYRQADALFAARQKFPLLLASSEHIYNAAATTFWAGPQSPVKGPLAEIELPRPTVVKASNADVVGDTSLVGSQITISIRGGILSDLLVSTELVCPLIKGGFNCPKKKPGCGIVPGGLELRKHPQCSFLSALADLGLTKRSILRPTQDGSRESFNLAKPANQEERGAAKKRSRRASRAPRR